MGMKEIKFEQKRALFLKLIKEQKQRNDLLRWIFLKGNLSLKSLEIKGHKQHFGSLGSCVTTCTGIQIRSLHDFRVENNLSC